ncbi:hypothetical protein SDC9_73068 [bioreactor metagenome]|uniref:Uncharacterized protein n=1 Tax=bioreactor metagenome TaxID=1076179 RepID=A0A644YKB7_9ZZZZ
MKKIKTLKGWGIYQNNIKEVKEYGFEITVLTPDNMEYAYMCSPSDTDMEFDSIEAAEHWIRHY